MAIDDVSDTDTRFIGDEHGQLIYDQIEPNVLVSVDADFKDFEGSTGSTRVTVKTKGARKAAVSD